MEQNPAQQEKKKKTYEEALALAKADKEWIKTKIVVLENHLVETASKTVGLEMRSFARRVQGLKSLKKLTQLGNDHRMLDGFDLEKKAVIVFCRKNNIELIG